MNIIDFGQEVSLFHGQSQFTLLQVFSWCLAMSIKVRQPCLEFCSIDCELINGYCRKLLKKKKRPGKNGTLHQRSPSKLQMPMDGVSGSLIYRKGSMWLSYLEVLFQLGKQLEGWSIKATICYLQAWWLQNHLYLESQFWICDIQSFICVFPFQWIQLLNKTNVLDRIFLDPDANVFEMLTS